MNTADHANGAAGEARQRDTRPNGAAPRRGNSYDEPLSGMENDGSQTTGTYEQDRRTNTDDLEAAKPPRRKRTFLEKPKGPLPFSERVVRLTWAWFLSTMSTGGLAVVLGNQPYTFTGLETIGKIFYILNLVMFFGFTALIAARFAYKPRAFTTSLHHPSESFFFGAWWVTVSMVLNGAQVYGVPACGPWLVSALRVLFWMYFASAFIVAVLQYHIIFDVEKLSVSEALPSWILPAYPFLTTGPLAASIAESQDSTSATQIIVAGLMGQGLGWILAIFIYVVYLTRLINHSMPSPATRPAMFVSVGPAAFTVIGLIALGGAAQEALPSDYLGVTSVSPGDIWKAASVPAALFLWLVALWFAALSIVSVLRVATRMSFAMQWWGLVFPNAGLTLSTIRVGEALDSPGIKWLGSAMTIILVLLWFLCLLAQARALYNRELLAIGKDLGVEDVNLRHDEKKKAGRWLESHLENP